MTMDGSDRSFGAPRFDVVLRGYDRRQVDEHISRLQRVLSRMRTDLDAARGHPVAPLQGPAAPPGVRPRPTPRPRPDALPGDNQDVVGTFTGRMQAILQAAEEEAGEIRGKAKAAARADEERAAAARAAVRAEEDNARSTLSELLRQRDAVLADLTRVRGQLEALLSGPTARIKPPKPDTAPAPEARREAGAGQPLPGSTAGPDAGARPAPPLPSATHAPPPRVPLPQRDAGAGGRASASPVSSPAPSTTGELFRSVASAPRGGPVVPPDRSAVEETMVAPAVQKPEKPSAEASGDGRDDAAETSRGVEATQVVEAVRRPAPEPDEDARKADAASDGPEATQVHRTSAARSG